MTRADIEDEIRIFAKALGWKVILTPNPRGGPPLLELQPIRRVEVAVEDDWRGWRRT